MEVVYKGVIIVGKFKISQLILFILILVCVSFQVQAAQVKINNQVRIQGDLVVIQISDFNQQPMGTFLGQSIDFYRHKQDWVALLGISYWVKPAKYTLKINLDGEQIDKKIQVVAGDFKESRLTVSKKQEKIVRPTDKKVIERKKRERDKKAKAYNHTEDKPLWQKPFLYPTHGHVTTGYGYTRYVNGKLNNRHSGVDIANNKGTAIKAVNDGIVRLADNLLVTGNSIVVDHGAGLCSVYYHLSKMNVEVGDRVERGEIIGEMGSTGFSTGSHLHWKMMIGNANLNPNQFVDTTLFDKLILLNE